MFENTIEYSRISYIILLQGLIQCDYDPQKTQWQNTS